MSQTPFSKMQQLVEKVVENEATGFSLLRTLFTKHKADSYSMAILNDRYINAVETEEDEKRFEESVDEKFGISHDNKLLIMAVEELCATEAEIRGVNCGSVDLSLADFNLQNLFAHQNLVDFVVDGGLTVVLGKQVFEKIVFDQNWLGKLQDTSQADLIQKGEAGKFHVDYLGEIYRIRFLTDAFLPEHQQVLGHRVMIGSSDSWGKYLKDSSVETTSVRNASGMDLQVYIASQLTLTDAVLLVSIPELQKVEAPVESASAEADPPIYETDTAKVYVLDAAAPSFGNGTHHYAIYAKDNSQENLASFMFRCGPVETQGINGIEMEHLLAICAHRLRGYQAGPFACNANEQALNHIASALHWLEGRTSDRKERGVEGKPVQ